MVSPSKTPKLTSPSQTCKVSPLEGAEGCGLVAKMLWHVMPVKAEKIPMTVMKIRIAEIILMVGLLGHSLLVGLLGHSLQSSVAPDRKLEVQ
jgi:hypothetical protein